MSALAPRLDLIILRAASAIRWRAVVGAPSTLEALQAEHARSGEIVVDSRYSRGTIHGSPAVNWALRAVHDADHVRHGCAFDRHGELSCAVQATGRLVRRGPLRDVLMADLVGQVEHFYAFGRFPHRQRAFVIDYLNRGRQLSAAF